MANRPRTEEGGHQEAEEQEFPLEADLRDFLAHNLSVIEPGLQLYRECEKNWRRVLDRRWTWSDRAGLP